MKRYAAHYLFLPDTGFIKQYAVEVCEGGVAQRIFPLTEEVESVEWLPGVIVLLAAKEIKHFGGTLEASRCVLQTFSYFRLKQETSKTKVSKRVVQAQSFLKAFDTHLQREEKLYLCLLYPFDFISMQPVVGTRHRLLR